MRIWLQYLYHDLYTLPSTNYSIEPDHWNTLAPCLSDQMTFTKRPPGTMIPVGGTLVPVKHVATPDLEALQSIRISDKRIWMRISSKVTRKNQSPVWKHWRRLQSYGYLAKLIQDIVFQSHYLPSLITQELNQVVIAFFLPRNLNVGSLRNCVFFPP